MHRAGKVPEVKWAWAFCSSYTLCDSGDSSKYNCSWEEYMLETQVCTQIKNLL